MLNFQTTAAAFSQLTLNLQIVIPTRRMRFSTAERLVNPVPLATARAETSSTSQADSVETGLTESGSRRAKALDDRTCAR